METFRVQAQIRANAEEVQDSLQELRQWEQQMSKKDAEIKRRKARTEQGQENQVGHKSEVCHPRDGRMGVVLEPDNLLMPCLVTTVRSIPSCVRVEVSSTSVQGLQHRAPSRSQTPATGQGQAWRGGEGVWFMASRLVDACLLIKARGFMHQSH